MAELGECVDAVGGSSHPAALLLVDKRKPWKNHGRNRVRSLERHPLTADPRHEEEEAKGDDRKRRRRGGTRAGYKLSQLSQLAGNTANYFLTVLRAYDN